MEVNIYDEKSEVMQRTYKRPVFPNMTSTISSAQKTRAIKTPMHAINIYNRFNVVSQQEPLHIQLYK